MKIRISLLDDLQTVAGILIKNGYTVKRVKVKSVSGKSNENGLKVSDNKDFEILEDEE